MNLMIVAIMTGILFSACSSDKHLADDSTPEAVPIPVVRLKPKDTTILQEYVADIQASRNVEIRAKIQGFVDKILVDEGEEVKKGELLFVLNNGEYRMECSRAEAALASAEAEAKAARLELSRVQTLVNKNVISKIEYDLAGAKVTAAEARVQEAKSNVESAQIRLSYTYIRSPFNGMIDRIPQKLGSLVDEGTLLTTLSDLHKMYAYFPVSENEYLAYLRAKQEQTWSSYDNIVLVLADGSRFSHHGKVETVESEVNSHTGSIAFRATFPNPDKLLKHGASGKVLLESSLNDALILPQKAVVELQDRSFVYVVDKDNKVHMKSFLPKTKINQFVVVQSGLSENDAVVYEGIQNIRDGSIIEPRFIMIDSLSSLTYRR